MAALVCLVLLLAMTGHSSALYCICKTVSDTLLQTNIDYACGAGADCTAITQNGACYNPNTVKDHCDYAVNSYFQSKGEAGGTCDFKGTATTSSTIPNQASGCVYPSSATSSLTPPTTTNTPPTTTTTTNSPPPPVGSNFSPPLFNTNGTVLGPSVFDPNHAVLYRSFHLVLVSLPLYLLWFSDTLQL